MALNQRKSGKIPSGIWITSAVALTFGALTLVSGGRALFGLTSEGDFVPFVLWFNFLSGFAYMAIGLGIALSTTWVASAATALAIAIVVIFALLGWHILQDNPYEMRTVGAMILRAGIWIAIAVYLHTITPKS